MITVLDTTSLRPCPKCGAAAGEDHYPLCPVRLLALGKNAEREPGRFSPVGVYDLSDEICPRCGVLMHATHHPLCQYSDGTQTELSDDEVRRALEVLERNRSPFSRGPMQQGDDWQPDPDEIPF
jgi:ribosomal protein S27AE